MCIFIVRYPLSSANFTIYAPRIGTLLYGFISSRENSAFAHFAAAIANHYNLFSFRVPPGTHHCWVDKGSVIWEACLTPLHMAGSVAMCYHLCGIRSCDGTSLWYITCSLQYVHWERHISSVELAMPLSSPAYGSENQAPEW